jgi:PAS domain S-box-containing protein
MVLLRNFNSLEEDFARQNLGRATSAISNELDTLERTTGEYASWDQTYNYLHGKLPNYPKTEFPVATFQHLKVNFVVIFDNSGHMVLSKGFSLVTLDEVRVPPDLFNFLQPGSPLLSHQSESSKKAGILLLASGPVFIDSHPVLTNESKGPIAGTLIMGRSLDSDEVVRLGAMTHLPLEIGRLDGGKLAPELQTAASLLSNNNPTMTLAHDQDHLAAYQQLNDIYDKPALIVRVLLPRRIYHQGQTSLVQFLLLLLAAGFVFGAVTLYLLERTVLSRVANLTERITEIGASGDLSGRLTVSGTDELGYLGESINGMLEDLEKIQSERQQGEARLSVMVENMPAVLWTTDRDLRFTYSVGAGLKALDLRPNQTVGKSLFEYFRTGDPEFAPIAAHRQALAGEPVTYEMEWEKRIFESHVQPLRSSEGEIVGVVGVALDITDRQHLLDQLRQSQKMQAVGELAGGVAHDFNNLLMVVKGHSEILLDRLPDKSSLRRGLEQIHGASERAASLTRQLLAFSRKQVLQPRVLDLNEVVSGMIEMVSRTIGANIELSFLPGLTLGRVKADPTQMEQIVLNLVVNARDAMPDGGALTIETSNVELDRHYAAKHAGGVQPGPYVMLTVSDTGCGMDAATQARIFEPFFTTKAQGKGTGLGLATVYGVVKQSGGFIWVYSEVGRGTTFKIYLPRVAAQVEQPARDAVSKGPIPGTETILFVEDEESVRELVREFLGAAGYRVLEAADGIHALEVAARHKGPIHMLITDVVMPRLSGRELVNRLTTERGDVKVLYISGYTDDSVFRHGVLEGGVAFLQKPFNLKSLAKKIRELLDGRPVPAGSQANLEED